MAKSKKKKRASAKSTSRTTGSKRSSARKKRAPRRWRRWLLLEVATWATGVTLGLAATSALIWVRAHGDVADYLAAPPRPAAGVVWSAPITVRAGMALDPAAFQADLLAAGYERAAGQTTDDDSFTVVNDTIHIGAQQVRLRDGKVRETVPAGGIRLRPTILGTLGDPEARRHDISLSEVSTHIEPALLSMEDSRFRDHHGVDPIGVLRAIVYSMVLDRRQGGSTITQQLAKNLFLTQDRTVRRKIREVFFAAALESELSKDALLELYLEQVYLGQMGGQPLYGFEQAARAWFGVGAGSLTRNQSATIVGTIPSPNAYSPVRHPEVARQRRDLVLRRMFDQGHIDANTLAAEAERPLSLSGLAPSRVRRAPYAVDAAVERAEAAMGHGALTARNLHLHTTIDPVLQRAAEEAIAQGMAELDADYPRAAGAQVALVAVRTSDGAVVALVGGRSYGSSPFNRATDARRHPGSTVKPFTVLRALADDRITPATLLQDEPIERRVDGKLWAPTNFDGGFVGPVTVRRAIEGSRNVPAVLLAEQVGPHRLRSFLHDAGLKGATALPSAALGAFEASPLQLAGAYTVFASGTAWHPRLIDSVLDAEGRVVVASDPRGNRIADPVAAAQALSILQGVLTSGTGARAARFGVGPPAGGKTGTTDGYRDAWFAGVTPELAVAVWVGNDRKELGLSGSRAALPTWARFVAAAGPVATPHTPGLIHTNICAESGLVPRDTCEDIISEGFRAGTEPSERCDVHGPPPVGRILSRIFSWKAPDAAEAPPARRKRRRRNQ